MLTAQVRSPYCVVWSPSTLASLKPSILHTDIFGTYLLYFIDSVFFERRVLYYYSFYNNGILIEALIVADLEFVADSVIPCVWEAAL